jgi:cytosine/adenosine deaminase-related metal-dependent hydrolase
MSTKAAHEAIAALNREEGRDDINRTVHAPYSCHADLIRAVKERSRRQQRIFPLHVAESAVEVDFLRHGSGGFRELLVARNVWDGSFVPMADNNQGSVNYLDGLGVIDSRTLCVHAVHVSKQEITLLAEKRAKICICPGSNRYLGVGRAPVADMLASGIVPALGTDSLASNRELNLWQEMKIVRADHPGIRPSSIFAMATRSGAEALGYGDQMGRLHQGLQASVLAVESPEIKRSEVFDYLTTIGRQAKVRWACSNAAENGGK